NADGVSDALERNIISGNGFGVEVDQTGAGGSAGTVVAGNFVGTDATGTFAVPNTYGIGLAGGASSITIGGTTAAARNIISGNKVYGVRISDSGTNANVVEGNLIGTNASGA